MDSTFSSKPFPGFSRVYRVDDPCADHPFRASLHVTDEFALLRGEAKPDLPIAAQWAMGSSKPGDVVWTTSATPVLVSQSVVNMLHHERFTGWDALAVELREKSGSTLPYYFLSIQGRCGPIDNTRSIKVDRIMPGGSFPRWHGIYFDSGTWDGSDVFTSASDVAWIFVVEAVKLAFEKAKIKNVVFTPLDQVERRTI
jgi:hypothetical protein